jgi:hypothetical protein
MSESALVMDDYKSDDSNYITLISEDDELKEIANFIENKVISADGLTLAEVFQALVQMLNGDLVLVKKVLAYARIMATYGMKVEKESQLSKADVRRALEGKESNRQDFIKTLPTPPTVKLTKKKGRGL